jgi:Zn-dependent protease with chaperone function
VLWFSLQREFRADRGGATLAGTPSMIGALEWLEAGHHEPLSARPRGNEAARRLHCAGQHRPQRYRRL